MSAYGYKRTLWDRAPNVRFTPESGHSQAQERFGLKKQTLDVRLTPNFGEIVPPFHHQENCIPSAARARGWQLFNVNNLKLTRFKEIFPAAAKRGSFAGEGEILR